MKWNGIKCIEVVFYSKILDTFYKKRTLFYENTLNVGYLEKRQIVPVF
jgi:hypothetical protein